MDHVLERLSVLIIDDFHTMRSNLSGMLLSMGARQEPDVAANAEDALGRLRAKRYDIVLCDYNLGAGMDGQQLLETARREGRVGVGTAFLMITAENTPEMVMAALESAPDAYLAKPITKDLLAVRLQRVLRRRLPLRPVADALSQKDLSGARSLLQDMLATGRGQRADVLRLQADLALEENDADGMEAAARAALAEQEVAWAHVALGQAQEMRGDDGRAEACYRKALEVTPHFMSAHDRLAGSLERQGRSADAFKVLIEAIRRSGRSLGRQRHLGRLSMELQHWEQAVASWKQAVQLGQSQGAGHPSDAVWLAHALARHGESSEAGACLKQMRTELRGHEDFPWWELVGHLLVCNELALDKEAILDTLDVQLSRGQPPALVRAALIQGLSHLGEVERAEMLRQEDL
ncbi:response regulator [Ectothiorhodospira variabilis]|uniref:response regulator n=1 Tax=Ectothiorhodospira variabilis TaxID=505694 RepID=UPI001EFBF1AB|nr:response regulator [Ectothiorhodospira variabilis]MCG5493667.1 response regulator [Ectothiorhodospira variabilis]MCG5502996.1 response regulator [Ectothiorhodospira variabilis]MCG5506216.1 response regulator [Ectothiorhodospira variabilis]